jgi:hypothetical protein
MAVKIYIVVLWVIGKIVHVIARVWKVPGSILDEVI